MNILLGTSTSWLGGEYSTRPGWGYSQTLIFSYFHRVAPMEARSSCFALLYCINLDLSLSRRSWLSMKEVGDVLRLGSC